MTRKLLIIVAILIALTPFLGLSSTTSNFITTALALFSAITLFFSRKPKMRHASREVQSPYMPTVQVTPGTETHVVHDETAHVAHVTREISRESHETPAKEVQVGPIAVTTELPTHPIAPRPRRKKAPALDLSVAPAEDVPLPFHEAPSLPLGVAVHSPRPVRARRAKTAKSILAEEEPIRPADAVIPAHELAAEHSAFYHSHSDK